LVIHVKESATGTQVADFRPFPSDFLDRAFTWSSLFRGRRRVKVHQRQNLVVQQPVADDETAGRSCPYALAV
jgi:hypothetical protein